MSGLNFTLTGALETSRELGAMARKLPTFHKRAIGTLRRSLPTEARRSIQDEYNIKAGRVRQDLSVRNLSDGLRLTGHFKGIGLRNFAARQTLKGVTSQIMKGKRSLDEGAFMAPLLGGGVQAVERGGEKRVMTRGNYQGKKRQPLYVLYGATVAQMLRKGRRPERLKDFAIGVLSTDMDRQLKSLSTTRPSAGT